MSLTASAIQTKRQTQALGLCPVCQAIKFSRVFTVPETLVPSGQLTLERCSTCDLVFLNPRLTQRAIESIEDASTYYDLGVEQVAERLLALDGLVQWLERSATRRGSLLDIGCNRGFLLEAARRRGWDVLGVELSEVAAERARREFGLTVYTALEAIADQEFDLITAWHVLEHTLDPIGFLRKVGTLLGRDGMLAVQVPSFGALATFVERGAFSSLVCAVHTFYFERETLTRTISEAGLTVVDVLEEDTMLTATCFRSSNNAENKPPVPGAI